MRSAANVGWVAGPLVVLAYLAGAALSTWMKRRAREVVLDALSEAGLALAVVFVGWEVSQRVAPGFEASRVGFESVQVLLAWESVGLWCGAAAILGIVSPVFNGFRGTSGLAAGLAIAVVHAPGLGFAALGGFLAGLAIFRGGAREAVALALATVPTYAWVTWSADVHQVWGVNHGPELALWSAAVTSILLTAWWRPPEAPPPAGDP